MNLLGPIMDEPYGNTNQRHDRRKKEQQDGDAKIQKTENEPLAERTLESQDETSEGQALGERRPDNQDDTSEGPVLGVRRSDNQDKTSEEQALGVRRPDNQGETSEGPALGVRRPDNQDETSEGPVLGVRRSDNQDKTSEQRALGVRRPDNQDKTSEEQALGVRRPDNQGETSEGPALGVRRPDNQDETSEGPALGVRRPDNQDETSEGQTFGVKKSDKQEQTECSPPEKLLRDEISQRAADLCEAALKSVYKTTGSFIQMIPWVDDDKRPYIMNLYTKLVTNIAVARHPLSFKLIPIYGELKSYEGIFLLKAKGGETVKLCVFNGLPGRGKSSLFDKMAYDWAIGSVPAMQGYKLVVLLKMHALEQRSDLVDAMFDQLLAEDVGFEKGDLQSYIENNPEKVLILLDGFDELITTNLSESSFGSILNILNRKMFRGCCALVSTRPSHYDKLVSKQLVQNPFKHIRVMGFGAEEVYVYVHRFYFEEHDKAKALFAQIWSSNILSELAKSPMLLLLMCLLWREDSKFDADTISRLYSEAVKYIFRRKGDVSEEDTAKCVHEIGKVGLKGLLSPNHILSFKEKDFERDDLMRLAIKVGILTSQKVLKKLDTHNSVQFIHKTFQEYCSGKYLKHLQEVDPVLFQKNLDQIMSLHPENFEFVLRSCCGDSEECTRAVLQLLRARFPDKCSFGESLGNLAAVCYVEGQSAGLVDEEFLHFLIPSHLQIRSSEPLTRGFLKFVADHAKDRGSDCLAKVEEVRIETTNDVDRPTSDLTKPLAYLKGCMSAMTNLKGLVVAGYSIKEKDEDSVPEFFCMLHKLDYLRFEGCVGGSKRFWSNLFKAIKNLNTLALLSCRFTQQEVDCCTEAMINLSSLVKFEVSESREVGRESSTLMFTGNNLKCIAESLVNVPNFAELRIEGCYSMAGSSELWYMYLKQLSHLQKLSIVTCLLTEQDMKLVAEAFSGLPNLEELDLSDNHLYGPAASWAFQLQSLQRLQKINLSYCGLLGPDMKLIAEAMGSLPYLKELNLSRNKDLHSSARLWSAYLRALKHLQKLEMRECKLTEHDVEHVAEALGDLPDLVEVGLSDNKFLGGSGNMWSIYLKQVKNLDISNCFVDEPNMKRFAETLGHLVNLVELKVSIYRRPGSSGQVFCELFRNLENLQKLNLFFRPLNGGDMEHVLGSLSRLCNLTELDLSVYLCNDAGEMWPEQLQLPVSLRKLKLISHSRPGGDGMNRILGSLSRLPNLVEVGACERNRSLSGTAALWSNHLQQFNELQKLDLEEYALTEDDEKVLRDSLMARGRKGLVIAFPYRRPSDPLF